MEFAVIRRNIRLTIRVRLILDDGTVTDINRRTRARILSSMQGKNFETAHLCVLAGGELLNEGIYHDNRSLRMALEAFTEPALLEFLQGAQ